MFKETKQGIALIKKSTNPMVRSARVAELQEAYDEIGVLLAEAKELLASKAKSEAPTSRKKTTIKR